MKVIFLDIDGVLNSNYNSGIDKTMSELFNKIISETNAKVVISSSWRTEEYVYDILKESIPNIIDRTDVIKCDFENYKKNRADEINKWLNENDVEKFAVIDDLELPIDNLFKTDPYVGLTTIIACDIIKFFND